MEDDCLHKLHVCDGICHHNTIYIYKMWEGREGGYAVVIFLSGPCLELKEERSRQISSSEICFCSILLSTREPNACLVATATVSICT